MESHRVKNRKINDKSWRILKDLGIATDALCKATADIIADRDHPKNFCECATELAKLSDGRVELMSHIQERGCKLQRKLSTVDNETHNILRVLDDSAFFLGPTSSHIRDDASRKAFLAVSGARIRLLRFMRQQQKKAPAQKKG